MISRRRFLQGVGALAAAASARMALGYGDDVSPLLGQPGESKRYSEVAWRSSLRVFRRFERIWQFDDFWTRGNTFDACLKFVTTVSKRWPSAPEVVEMMRFACTISDANVRYFQAHLIEPGVWADDFSWWGNACVTASRYFEAAGMLGRATQFRILAEMAWSAMMVRGYDFSSSARPVAHGCANAPATGHAGTKNTVTNAGLFLLSARLYQLEASYGRSFAADCLDVVRGQFDWFSAWFAEKFAYFRSIRGYGGRLVCERPIATPDYERKVHPDWQLGWVWTGDQGLVLASLIRAYELRSMLLPIRRGVNAARTQDSDVDARLEQWIAAIESGVRIFFGEGFTGSDGVLREAPFGSAFRDDPRDYVCGRGVLARHLSELSKTSLGLATHADGMRRTAKAMWQSCTSDGQVQASWGSEADEISFNEQFIHRWGYGDAGSVWKLQANQSVINGVLQGMGLDVSAAAIAMT